MNKRNRLFAFILALLMVFTLFGCQNPTPGSAPTTGTSPTTHVPSTPSSMEDAIFTLISRLENELSATMTDYEDALVVLADDFLSKPDGLEAEEFLQTKIAMQTAMTERRASISSIIEILRAITQGYTTDVSAKIAEAEMLLSDQHHSYGTPIYHSRNPEGTPCTEADMYRICTLCNHVQWIKAEHQWYYSRTEAEHQLCCKMCATTKSAAQHDMTEGKCGTCSYVVNANILVIEGAEGESDKLCNTIGSKHTVTVVNAADSEKMPTTLEALQAYHEVILCNVANADLPEDFAELLQSYVRDYGGSLFTVGGDKAYQPEDMGGTTYEELLPVEMTVPSMAVMIIIDRSGSMWNTSLEIYEESKLYAAKQGAEACLDKLCGSDYVGIMAICDTYDKEVELIPRTQRAQIIDAINSIELANGSIFEGALVTARRALLSNTQVDKRHIIIITDGLPGDADPDMYLNVARQNAKDGITMSVVGLQCDNYAKRQMRELVKAGDMNEKYFYDVQELSQVANVMREGLAAPELRDIQCQRYMPSIVIDNSITENLTVENMPVLDGAYYSRLKEGATEVLGSPYGPLYAQWQYGKGMAGSFMCDLNGTWSAEFLASETGAAMIHGMISHLVNEKTSEEEVPSPAPTVGNQVGDLCPSTQLCILTGDGISSQTIDPSALGKITIINFWGVWCGPCKAELPYFDQVASMFADQVTVVAVHSIISVSDGPEYIAEKYPNSKIIFAVDNQCDETDIVGIRGELFLALGFRDLYPATVILDENGVILYSSTKSFLTLEELLAVLPEGLLDNTVS